MAFASLQRHRFLLQMVNGDHCLLVYVALVLHRHLHLHDSLLLRHLRSGDEHTVLCNVQGWHGLQPHMAVDARTRVPTAIGLLGVVHLHHDLVLSLLQQVGGDIKGEGGVAVGMLSCLLSVNEHGGMLIDAFEMEFHHFTFGGLEAFAVFTLTGLEPATTCARRTSGGVGSGVDVPVVGKVNTDGLAVLRELPIGVEECLLLS